MTDDFSFNSNPGERREINRGDQFITARPVPPSFFSNEKFIVLQVGYDLRLARLDDHGKEEVVAEVQFEDSGTAKQRFHQLTENLNNENPFLRLDKWCEPGSPPIPDVLIKTKYGELNYQAALKDQRIPLRSADLYLPSEMRDPLTGLPMLAGFLRSFTPAELRSSAGVLTVAEFDIGNLGAVNEVCGTDLPNELFKKMKSIATSVHTDLKIARTGGDEFALTIIGASAEANEAVLQAFRKEYLKERDALFAELSEDKQSELTAVCEKKRIAKGRQHTTEPLDGYLSSITIDCLTASIYVDSYELNEIGVGVVLSQLLGRADSGLYGLKGSLDREFFKELMILSPPRLAETEQVTSIFETDRRSAAVLSTIDSGSLSNLEKITAALECILTAAEDTVVQPNDSNTNSQGVQIFRGNRLDSQHETGITAADLLAKVAPTGGVYALNFEKFGKINDWLGASRADLLLHKTLKYLQYELLGTRLSGSSYVVREGGRFTVRTPNADLSPIELGYLEMALETTYYFHQKAVTWEMQNLLLAPEFGEVELRETHLDPQFIASDIPLARQEKIRRDLAVGAELLRELNLTVERVS